MIKNLNPWLRFWAMFGIVFLLSTVVLTVTVWPRRDTGVIADLRTPECSTWTETADGNFPAPAPDATEPCRALRTLLHRERVSIRSEADYDGFRLKTGVKQGITFLAAWAAFMGAIYVFGWAGAAATSALLKSGARSSRVPGDSAKGSALPRDPVK